MKQPNIQKVTSHCEQCAKMKFLVAKFDEEVIPKDIIQKMRKKCASCKRKNHGIYKADAILTALVLQKKFEPFGGKRSEGKKSTITEHERKSIKTLLLLFVMFVVAVWVNAAYAAVYNGFVYAIYNIVS